jgi:AhpD family alkylhydroperoxidase
MARIEGVPEKRAGLLGRFAYRFSRRRFGREMEPLTVLAHHPRLLFGCSVLELAFDGSHRVDERLKELAAIKTAAMVGCEFCLDIGSALGRKSGISEAQLRDLHDPASSAVFSSLEKLVLEYAAAMSRTPAVIPEELFGRLRERFDEPQLVELTTAIALENYHARCNHAFGIGSQGFSEGAYCPLPEARASA